MYQKSDATVRDRTVPLSLKQFQVEFLMALHNCGFYCTLIKDIEHYCVSAFPINTIGAFFQHCFFYKS